MEMEDAWGFDVNVHSVKGRSPNCRKWEGEDEEDNVMDSWDQEPEDCEGGASATSCSSRADRSDESGLTGSSSSQAHENGYTTPQLLDKHQLHKLQEEADLSLAREVFGGGQTILESEDSYARFKTKLLSVIDEATKNIHYASFTEDVVQNMCYHLTSNELKRIVISLSNLQIQKNSSKKTEKKKQKGKIRVKLRVDDDIHDYSKYSAYLEDDGYM